MSDTTAPRVAILGAGPIGLDAALACADAGLPYTVYEAGPAVASHVRDWGHVRLFTPWELSLSPRMRTRLGAQRPADGTCPTGGELARLLDAMSQFPPLEGHIELRTRVLAVARDGLLKHEQIGTPERAAAPFRLLLEGPEGERTVYAEVVLDCTGTYASPNALGDGGIPAPGERALHHRIIRTLPDTAEPDRWQGTVLLVGAGKSAQTAARDLARLPDTRLDWVVRASDPDWGEIPGDTLPGRQELVDTARELARGTSARVRVRTGARVTALTEQGRRIRATLDTSDGPHELACDHVVALTGYSGDAALHRQLQIHECYATAAPMNLSATLLGASGGDCLAQPPAGLDTLRNPEAGYYILGAKSYGRLNTFLLRTGYEQVGEVLTPYTSSRAGQRSPQSVTATP